MSNLTMFLYGHLINNITRYLSYKFYKFIAIAAIDSALASFGICRARLSIEFAVTDGLLDCL